MKEKDKRYRINISTLFVPTDIVQRNDIPDGAKLLYGVIYTRQNGEQPAFPSQKNMASHIGKSERTVRVYLKILLVKLLIRKKRFGRTKTNRYWVNDRTKPSSRVRQNSSSPERQNVAGHSNSKGNIKALSGGYKKPHWDGYRMTQLEDGMWRIKVDGEWKEFAGDPKDIELI